MMGFSDYLSDIFVPLFTKVGEWFVRLYEEVGFYELFLAAIVITLCFRIIIAPLFSFGGSSLIHSGMGRVESKRRAFQERIYASVSYGGNGKYKGNNFSIRRRIK